MAKNLKTMIFHCSNFIKHEETNIILKEVNSFIDRFKVTFIYSRGFSCNVLRIVDTFIDTMKEEYKFYLLYYNKKAIGCFCLKEKLNTAWIYDFGILPKYRQQGYGFMSINKIQEYCKERGYIDIKLNVKSNNQIALKLYQKSGFSLIGGRNKKKK